MIRITKKIKRLDLYASILNLLYIIIVGVIIGYLFNVMNVPDRANWVIDPINYTYQLIFNISMTQTTMNVIISLLVFSLIATVPMTFKSFQRYFDKKIIEVDEWDYRHQYLLGTWEIISLNPFSGAIRYYLGRHIQLYVVDYGMKQGIVNLSKTIKKGLVSTGKWLKQLFVSIGKLIFKISREIILFTMQLYYIILRGLRWVWHIAKTAVLSVKYLFVNKESKQYEDYLARKEAKKESIAKERLERKEASVNYKLARLEERDNKKQQAQTQEELDDVTRKDVIVKIIRMVLTYGTLTITALFIFVPFYWMIITSLKTYNESSSSNPAFFIGLSQMQWVNFKIALTEFNFLQFIGNTIFVGITTMFFTVVTTILAAFAFSRLDFRGRDFIFSLLLMTMMVPGELFTITNYITVSNLGWIDQYQALIFPFAASVFYIFFLRQTFRQIPDSLYRAARVDGASDFKFLTRVMIPIAAPTIVTIIILSSIGAWDAYIWPQLVSRSESTRLVSVALRNENFSVGTGSDARPMYNMQLAATTVVSIPLLIVFFSLKKYIIRGVGRSGTKG